MEDVAPLRRGLLVTIGLLIYLGFPGRGLQGTGLVGFLGGTIPATLGHALILQAFYFLERLRRSEERSIRFGLGFIASAALVFYCHFLSAVFLTVLLALYCLVFRSDFSGRRSAVLLTGPVLLAWPLAINYLAFRNFYSGTASLPDYPALIALMGADFLDRMLAEPSFVLPLLHEILIEFKWINLLLVLLFARYLARGLRFGIGGGRARFLLLAVLLLLWISQDESLAYLLYPFGIHWYRVFDLFFSFFALNLLFAFQSEQSAWADSARADLTLAALAGLLLLRFLFWDPVAHEKYARMDLESYGRHTADLEVFLDGLPPGSLILPEMLRNRDFQGSPHALDYYIQKHGHRNALGLTVESSLTAMLAYAYLGQGMPHIFTYGVDLEWRETLGREGTAPGALPAYLRRAGVEYVIGRTRRLQAYLEARTTQFDKAFVGRDSYVYRVRDARPALGFHARPPLGFLSYQLVRGEAVPGKPHRRFLLEANRVRGLLGPGPVLVNLDPAFEPARMAGLQNELGGLVLFHHGPGLAPSHEAHRFLRENRRLILVNFEKTEADPAPIEYLYTLLKVPGPRRTPDRPPEPVQARDLDGRPEHIAVAKPADAAPADAGGAGSDTKGCAGLEIKLSYFPRWRLGEQPAQDDDPRRLYQTEDNHMFVCTRGRSVRLAFESPLARAVTAMMVLLAGLWLAANLTGVLPRRRHRTRK